MHVGVRLVQGQHASTHSAMRHVHPANPVLSPALGQNHVGTLPQTLTHTVIQAQQAVHRAQPLLPAPSLWNAAPTLSM